MTNNYPEAKIPTCEILKLLKGQKALVTGASSGIGKNIALSLAKAGADVLINYINNEESVKEMIKEIELCGGKAVSFKADISKENQVQEMFQFMFSEFGTIDILVNNAGIQKDAPIDKMELSDWQKVIDINLTGAFLCTREAVKEFKRRGVVENISCSAGKIVFVSSVHEVIPWAGHVNYSASKGGIKLFMQSVAQEVAPYRIRANSIAPGAIKTDINRTAWETKEAEQNLLKLIPYNRVGETDDIGKIAVWLASDQTDYITGTTITVDGGMTLYPGFAAGG